jgi:chromosomal replication initiator protein
MAVSRKKQWEMLEQQLKSQIERDTGNILFRQILIGNNTGKRLEIFVRDNFSKTMIESHFLKKIIKFLNEFEEFNEIEELEFVLDPDRFREEDAKMVIEDSDNDLNEKKIHTSESKEIKEEEKYDIYELNDKYSFESFVVGSSNDLAHAYAIAVAKEPGTKANPLFIYGGSGLGKTHLMQAIGHYISEMSKGEKKVAYVTSEKFTNDFIDAIKSNNPSKFREKYRQVDVLLVDDIQFLVGKDETQKEFFHTFNSLVEAGKKQIVLTSDKPPAKLNKLEERLVSRFKAGLVADVQKPNLELRIAILQKEAKKLGIDMKPDILEYVAQKVVSNIRELEGAFNMVISYRSITGRELDETTIDKILKDFITTLGPKKVSIEDIKREVSDFYNVDEEDIMSAKRDQKTALARQIAMYLAYDLTGRSTTLISREFGKKDHTTVLHARKKIEKMLEEDEHYKKDLREIRGRLLE